MNYSYTVCMHAYHFVFIVINYDDHYVVVLFLLFYCNLIFPVFRYICLWLLYGYKLHFSAFFTHLIVVKIDSCMHGVHAVRAYSRSCAAPACLLVRNYKHCTI